MAATTSVEKREPTPVQAERTRTGPTFLPSCDIIENPEELLLVAEVPGVAADGIDIDFERGRLTLTARVAPRQEKSVNYLLREYEVGDFRRTFEVSESIDPAKISAEVKNGVLTVHLPKAESIKPRKIAVMSI